MDWIVAEVTKEGAAIRQLNQAIRLFFQRGDMLAVHTLTGAAFQILSDLGKPRGLVSEIRSENLIKSDRLGEWIVALNSTQNFLKHADRDRESSLRYVEEGTILYILEAVEFAHRVLDRIEEEWLAFRGWFSAAYPELIVPEALEQIRETSPPGIDATDRDLWAAWFRRKDQSQGLGPGQGRHAV